MKYSSIILRKVEVDLIDVVTTINNKVDVPFPVIYTCLVGGLIPLYLNRALFIGICNNVLQDDYDRSTTRLLLQGLVDKQLVRIVDNTITVRREVLVVIGSYFKPKIQSIQLFSIAVEFILKLTRSRVNPEYVYNYYIGTYYQDKKLFVEVAEESIKKNIDLYLISHSLRNLLDLESGSNSFKDLQLLHYKCESVLCVNPDMIKELHQLIANL